jgi:hypothetical protein
MSLESIKTHAINAVYSTKDTAVQTVQWLGRGVTSLAYKSLDVLSATGKTALYYLNSFKDHAISYGNYLKTNLPIQLGKTKDFVITHKEVTLGIVASVAILFVINKFFFSNSEAKKDAVIPTSEPTPEALKA